MRNRFKGKVLTVYNTTIFSYAVVGIVVFLYNMDSGKVSAKVESNQQRKEEFLHVFALSYPEDFKKMYGQLVYDDIIFRNSQINFLAKSQIRDSFAVQKNYKGYHIIQKVPGNTPKDNLQNSNNGGNSNDDQNNKVLCEQSSQSSLGNEVDTEQDNKLLSFKHHMNQIYSENMPSTKNIFSEDSNNSPILQSNISDKKIISPVQIYQGISNNNNNNNEEFFIPSDQKYSGIDEVADQMLNVSNNISDANSNFDINDNSVNLSVQNEGIENKNKIAIKFRDGIKYVDKEELDFENYDKEDGTPTVLKEEKEDPEIIACKKEIGKRQGYLDTNDFNYQQDFGTNLILDGQVKEAEENYYHLIINAKRLQFKFGMKEEAFSVYDFASQYKDIYLIKQDIINFVEKDSPRAALFLPISNVENIDYQVEAKDEVIQEEKYKSNSSTPEEQRKLRIQFLMKANNIDENKYLKQEQQNRAKLEFKREQQKLSKEREEMENIRANNLAIKELSKENEKLGKDLADRNRYKNFESLRNLQSLPDSPKSKEIKNKISENAEKQNQIIFQELTKEKVDVNNNSEL